MTMRQLQNRLARLVREQEALTQEMYNRGLEADWLRMEQSLELTGQVCLAILDEDVLNTLPEISGAERPEPGALRPDTVFEMAHA